MPAFIAMLLGGLISIAGTLAGRVLLQLGFGIVTYVGVTTTISYLQSQALASLDGAPAQLVQLIAFLGVGESFSIVMSAIAVRATLNGIQSNSFKRLVQT